MNCRVISSIPLSKVRWQDRDFCFRYQITSTELAPAIRKNGLLALPGVRCRPGGYQVLYGFRRLLACRSLKLRQLEAAVYPADLPDQRAVELVAADNHWAGIPVLDKAGFYQLVQRVRPIPDKEFLQRYSGQLGIPQSFKFLTLLKKANQLHPLVKKAWHNHLLSIDKIEILVGLPAPDQAVVARKVINCQVDWSKSAFSQAMEMLQEIKLRDHRTLSRIWDLPQIRKVLNADQTTAQQRGAALLQEFRKLRYPRLSKQLARVEQIKNRLSQALPRTVQLQIPAYLEGNTMTISIQAGTEEQFNQALTGLQDRIKKHQWQGLFRIVRGREP
jgi:hypothetical protein